MKYREISLLTGGRIEGDLQRLHAGRLGRRLARDVHGGDARERHVRVVAEVAELVVQVAVAVIAGQGEGGQAAGQAQFRDG